MDLQAEILSKVKKSVSLTDPNAIVILFGSRARGDQKADSDLDLLILLEKDKITREDEKRVKYPLYEIEFEYSQIISPLVLSKNDWETRHRVTPLFRNVAREGIWL
jgi:predicted nucleotidyltransferase